MDWNDYQKKFEYIFRIDQEWISNLFGMNSESVWNAFWNDLEWVSKSFWKNFESMWNEYPFDLIQNEFQIDLE